MTDTPATAIYCVRVSGKESCYHVRARDSYDAVNWALARHPGANFLALPVEVIDTTTDTDRLNWLLAELESEAEADDGFPNREMQLLSAFETQFGRRRR